MKTLLLFLPLFILSNLTYANETCYDLLAGQYINSGTVCISNDQQNLYVKYSTTDEWLINETHFWIGSDISQMPATKKGNPKIGNFPYKQENVNTNYVDFTIPLIDLGLPVCGSDLSFAAHASLSKELGDGVIQQETGWSTGERIVEKGSWAMYSSYTVSCTPQPPTVGSCETAFALGDTTFIDLGLTQKRWGWEISNMLPGTYLSPIYAGAGQNDITKGTHVGNLNIIYDGTTFIAKYELFAGYVLDETHLYVGFDHITTIAPGQYGNIHDLTYSSSDEFVLGPYNGEALFVVAHAVSCELIN